jgi:hypothetical protein
MYKVFLVQGAYCASFAFRLFRSVVRQRLVTMSPLSSDANVLSRSGSGRHARSASRALQGYVSGRDEDEGRADGPEVVAEAEVAAHDVLEEADRLRLDELVDHVAEDGADGVEALVRVADVREPGLVEQDLLHDEDRDGLAQLAPRLHNPQAQRDDLRAQQEVDHAPVVVLLRRA